MLNKAWSLVAQVSCGWKQRKEKLSYRLVSPCGDYLLGSFCVSGSVYVPFGTYAKEEKHTFDWVHNTRMDTSNGMIVTSFGGVHIAMSAGLSAHVPRWSWSCVSITQLPITREREADAETEHTNAYIKERPMPQDDHVNVYIHHTVSNNQRNRSKSIPKPI